jgi:hypothetical protein
MPNITLDQQNVSSVVARWRTLTAAINTDLTALIGQDGDEIVIQILDEAREETLSALVDLPVVSHSDADAFMEVAVHSLKFDQRDDGLEACLLRKAADFIETAMNVDYDAPATKLTT